MIPNVSAAITAALIGMNNLAIMKRIVFGGIAHPPCPVLTIARSWTLNHAIIF